MRTLLSVLVVSLANSVLKASGPLALGQRPLPAAAVKVTGLTAPVLLAGLIITDLGGRGWDQLEWTQLAGVGVAGVARLARTPMLLALGFGIAVTAVLRWQLGR